MKCNCGYEYLEDWETENNKQIGDEPFIRIDCLGRPFETDYPKPVDWGLPQYKKTYLYGCPKCHAIQFDFD